MAASGVSKTSNSSTFVKITNPLKSNKRLFGLITIAILIIAALGGGYYLRIQGKQTQFKEYKLQMLDFYFHKIERILNNRAIAEKSVLDKAEYEERKKEQQENLKVYLRALFLNNYHNKLQAKQGVNPRGEAIGQVRTQEVGEREKEATEIDPIKQDSILFGWLDQHWPQLQLKEEFSEFVLVYSDLNKEGELVSKQKSSLVGLPDIDPEVFLGKSNDTLSTGIIKSTIINGKDYLSIAREYVFNSNQLGGKKLLIIGLVDQETYNKETRELDAWLIALLFSFLLLCLIGLPFFKMIFIAEDERLFSSDVILAGISVVVGSPVVLIVFLSLMSYTNEYLIEIPGQLTALSNEISKRFIKENRQNVLRLNSLQLEKYNPEQGKDPEYYKYRSEDQQLKENFKYISKVDAKDGKVNYHINFIKAPEPASKVPKNLKSRSYFQDFKADRNQWQLNPGSSSGGGKPIPYAMRAVVSIESSQEEAVYILNSDTSRQHFKVGSSQLKSLHNPVLPFGYQFAVIDEEGEVWFHSEKGKSTLENLFEITEDAQRLRSAVLGRVEGRGEMVYHGVKQLYTTQPIKGTNLSIVCMYDVSLMRLRISEVLTISSIGIMVVFLILGIITIATVFLKNPKWGLYKYNTFLFEFLIPRSSKSGHYIYLNAVFGILFLIILSVSHWFDFKPASAFIYALLIVVWSYIIVFYSLADKLLKKSNIVGVTNLVLWSLVLVLNITIYYLLGENNKFIYSVLIQLACIGFILLFKLKTIQKLVSRLEGRKSNYKYWYATFTFSWLLLSSLLPTYIFFEQSGTIDGEVWMRTNQFLFANDYLNKKERLKKKDLPPIEGDEVLYESLYDKHLTQGFYLLKDYELSKTVLSNSDTIQPSFFRRLLWETRPIYDERIRDYQAFMYYGASDFTWSSKKEKDKNTFELKNLRNEKADIVLRLKAVETDLKNNVSEDRKEEAIQKAGISSEEISYYALLIFGLLLILFILGYLILFSIDRFFGFRFQRLRPNDFDNTMHENYLKRFVNMLESKKSNSGLLLIGIPFSGKSTFAKKIVEASSFENYKVLSFLKPFQKEDFKEIDQGLTKLLCESSDQHSVETTKSIVESADVFIVKNIEHNLKSNEANNIKLKVISYLISMGKRVIITSEIYPSQILSFYDNQMDAEGNLDAELASSYNSWRNILSAFPQVIIGIRDKRDILEKELKADEEFEHVPHENFKKLSKELGYSKFLPSLAPVLLSKKINENKEEEWADLTDEYSEEESKKNQDKAKQVLLDDQRMIMHVLNLCHGYYTDIWNSLPTRERYLLYDLAKDGFMNIKNGNSLFSLMKKGIIVWRDRPCIFNESFRNFIISSVSKNEALNYELKNRGKGSWGTVKVIFYLIIIAVITFIILGEPDLLKDFETFYGAVAGIGALVPLMSSLLSRGKTN